MKLVALRAFDNAPQLKIEITPKTDNFEHVRIVPKGFRFQIGGDYKTIKALVQAKDPCAEQVQDLVRSRAAVVDDGSPEVSDVIAQVDAEVKIEAAGRKAEAKAAAVRASAADQMAGIRDVLETLAQQNAAILAALAAKK